MSGIGSIHLLGDFQAMVFLMRRVDPIVQVLKVTIQFGDLGI